jgi:hypothetical protein
MIWIMNLMVLTFSSFHSIVDICGSKLEKMPHLTTTMKLTKKILKKSLISSGKDDTFAAKLANYGVSSHCYSWKDLNLYLLMYVFLLQ